MRSRHGVQPTKETRSSPPEIRGGFFFLGGKMDPDLETPAGQDPEGAEGEQDEGGDSGQPLEETPVVQDDPAQGDDDEDSEDFKELAKRLNLSGKLDKAARQRLARSYLDLSTEASRLHKATRAEAARAKALEEELRERASKPAKVEAKAKDEPDEEVAELLADIAQAQNTMDAFAVDYNTAQKAIQEAAANIKKAEGQVEAYTHSANITQDEFQRDQYQKLLGQAQGVLNYWSQALKEAERDRKSAHFEYMKAQTEKVKAESRKTRLEKSIEAKKAERETSEKVSARANKIYADSFLADLDSAIETRFAATGLPKALYDDYHDIVFGAISVRLASTDLDAQDFVIDKAVEQEFKKLQRLRGGSVAAPREGSGSPSRPAPRMLPAASAPTQEPVPAGETYAQRMERLRLRQENFLRGAMRRRA